MAVLGLGLQCDMLGQRGPGQGVIISSVCVRKYTCKQPAVCWRCAGLEPGAWWQGWQVAVVWCKVIHAESGASEAVHVGNMLD